MEYYCDLTLEVGTLKSDRLEIARCITEQIGYLHVHVIIEALREDVVRPVHREGMRERVAAGEPRGLSGAGECAVQRGGIGRSDEVRDRPGSLRGIGEAHAWRGDRVLALGSNHNAIGLALDKLRHRVPIRIVINPSVRPGAGIAVTIPCARPRDRRRVNGRRIAQRVNDRVRNCLALRERHRIDEDHSRAAGTRAHGSRQHVRRVTRVRCLRCIRQAGFARRSGALRGAARKHRR